MYVLLKKVLIFTDTTVKKKYLLIPVQLLKKVLIPTILTC